MKSVHDRIQEKQALKEALRADGVDLKLKDVVVHSDDPNVRFEEFRDLQLGVHDVIVWDAGTTQINNTYVHGFQPGEDFVFFKGMEGQELFVAGDHLATSLTPAGSDEPHHINPPPDGFVVLRGQPYNVELMNNIIVLPTHRFDITFEGTMVG